MHMYVYSVHICMYLSLFVRIQHWRNQCRHMYIWIYIYVHICIFWSKQCQQKRKYHSSLWNRTLCSSLSYLSSFVYTQRWVAKRNAIFSWLSKSTNSNLSFLSVSHSLFGLGIACWASVTDKQCVSFRIKTVVGNGVGC